MPYKNIVNTRLSDLVMPKYILESYCLNNNGYSLLAFYTVIRYFIQLACRSFIKVSIIL